ncbi:MAG: ribonuclease HII [Chloroflexi bacterium]|nr:ribonuclease HII [Chloroflexota bacterium]
MAEPVPSLKFEKQFWSRELTRVAGLDEVGRGAWAGPVVAGAVILPRDVARRALAGVHDSKLLTPAQREELVAPIRAHALACATGLATCDEIDTLGIVPATRLAMMRALDALGIAPDALLIDALNLPARVLPQNAIIRGDQQSLSIACASILAKTTRDQLMRDLDAQIPGYAFAQHKGYGTAQHRAALKARGVSREHRRTFAPVKNWRQSNADERE